MGKLLVLLSIVLAPMLASAQLQWRISVKLIADANGNPAPNAFLNISNELVLANQLLDGYGRGYKFAITEILTLTGVSQWYNAQARNNSNKLALQTAAQANPGLYALRGNAINLYIVNGISGVCSFSRDGDDIILAGANAYRTLVLHECGHFFNLEHTHLGESYLNANGSPCTNGCACARIVAGEADFTLETAADNECYGSLDAVAQGAFGQFYTNLNASQQWRVDNTWRNIMSYHPQEILNVLTDDQLDRMTDESNGRRINVGTGRTWFVDLNGAAFGSGSSQSPILSPFVALVYATDFDIIMFRAGTYNISTPRTFTKPITLRATRGEARLGPL